MSDTVSIDRDVAAKLLVRFDAAIAALEADVRADMILAWDYGLGVAFDGNREPIAVSLDKAQSFSGRKPPTVRNGHNEPAKLVHRQKAITAEVLRLRKLAAEIGAALAA